jgi:hypothetical protein
MDMTDVVAVIGGNVDRGAKSQMQQSGGRPRQRDYQTLVSGADPSLSIIATADVTAESG